jgi:hypothetical protein
MRCWPALAAALACVAVAGDAGANGRAVQRDVVGRVVAVDATRGTLVVEREFRGRRYRLTLRARPDTPTFACADDRASLDELQAGDPVSVYFEPMGRGALANLVVVGPR